MWIKISDRQIMSLGTTWWVFGVGERFINKRKLYICITLVGSIR